MSRNQLSRLILRSQKKNRLPYIIYIVKGSVRIPFFMVLQILQMIKYSRLAGRAGNVTGPMVPRHQDSRTPGHLDPRLPDTKKQKNQEET